EATLHDLQRTMANVQDTTKSLDEIVQRIDQGKGVLGELTGDSRESRELAHHLHRSIRSVDEFTGRLNRGNVLDNLDHAVADLGTAIVDMQQHVDGLQKNLETFKKVKSALGG